MDIKQKIEKWVKEVLGKNELVLVHPKEIQNGDYSFFLAPPKLSVKESHSPKTEDDMKDAKGAAEILEKNKISEVEKVEAVGPFVNIFLSKQFFANSVSEVVEKGEEYGKSDLLHGQMTIIEYTNTNVLKPLHIGHLMGNVIGQSISNIFESSGAEVKRNTYQGDVGLHIAKAVWGIQKQGGIVDGSLAEKVEYIGKAYALGANAYEDDATAQEEIKSLNKKIYEKSDEEPLKIYEWGREISLAHFEELYKKLNTKFDYYFFESEVSEDAKKIVSEFLTKGVFEESEGALIFRGEKYDPKLHTRVFLTREGLPLYEAKDVAHALRKFEKYKFDKSIIITANEQDGYFKVVLKAMSLINPEIAQKTEHLSHGMLRLSTGKMSSRKGNVVTGESLISDVEDLIREKIADRELSEGEKINIAEMVAIGAIKYSILRQAIGGDIVFDFDKSISFEGDSGPYLQYSAVRARSVLQKSKIQISNIKTERPENWDVTEVEKLVYRFPEVVERGAREYAPHYLVTYLTELASSFNSFYANNQILSDDDSSKYKIALTNAVATVLTNGLHLLGIKVPERM